MPSHTQEEQIRRLIEQSVQTRSALGAIQPTQQPRQEIVEEGQSGVLDALRNPSLSQTRALGAIAGRLLSGGNVVEGAQAGLSTLQRTRVEQFAAGRAENEAKRTALQDQLKSIRGEITDRSSLANLGLRGREFERGGERFEFEKGKRTIVPITLPDGTKFEAQQGPQGGLFVPDGQGNFVDITNQVLGIPGANVGGEAKGVTVNIGPQGETRLDKTNVSRVQDRIIKGRTMLLKMRDIGERFAPEFLTVKGKAKAAAGSVLDKIADTGGDFLDELQKHFTDTDLTQFNAKRVGLVNQVEQMFQDFRIATTGVQAGLKELEIIRGIFLNTDLGPEGFAAAFEQIMSAEQLKLEMLNRLLKVGIPADQGDVTPQPIGSTGSRVITLPDGTQVEVTRD